jgi:hypothetical protein
MNSLTNKSIIVTGTASFVTGAAIAVDGGYLSM